MISKKVSSKFNFKCRFTWIWIMILICQGCWPRSCSKKNYGTFSGSSTIENQRNKGKGTKVSPGVLRVIKVMGQADSIFREAIWVITGKKFNIDRSPFGKIRRAYVARTKLELGRAQKIFKCDEYRIKPQLPLSQKTFEIFESCEKSKSPKEFSNSIATWQKTGNYSLRIEYEPSKLEEVVGLASSLFGRKATCEVGLNKNYDIENMTCNEVSVDRNSKQVLKFSEFVFAKSGNPILKLKVEVLEELLTVSTIESLVPPTGKILVVENEVEVPGKTKPIEPTPPKQENLKKQIAKNQQKNSAGSVVDPDLMHAIEVQHQQAMDEALKEYDSQYGGLTPEELAAGAVPVPPADLPMENAPGEGNPPGYYDFAQPEGQDNALYGFPADTPENENAGVDENVDQNKDIDNSNNINLETEASVSQSDPEYIEIPDENREYINHPVPRSKR